ncbi:HAD-IB family hydrolase [Pseudomonas syringae pv. aptata]|jgi:HAD superfamily hydrolase (TIGR01490 family)|uniref:Histidinol-phosphatase n=5 Tax=Pseudomonas syringae TaxID=317 RepID=A0AAQ1LCZ1_PSESX|nr:MULTISPECIES: HAD family hydrolase [Pseudomonas]AKF53672.1 HAD-superfamily subfamily IB hydrolase,TIGR01490 [Pseudomonas syringae pv. syringae HS191]ALU62780.1 phosphoserine phosphatase [Pseudomonas syringae pv. lapsa]AVX25704.1 HAD-IB family hydrolase [Pseudomonas syringae pv. atrofaciens]AZG88772.1 HAD family hydrolase [Pseudomonas syringae pv. pisi str. PP1]EKG34681.1 HAD-super family hydrolase [Pseudomonas syringae pv. avellanae str. ISPaVe013]
MRLALFDLDNTLLGGDSDHAWGDYLCRRGILDAATYKTRNDEFYQDYLAGTLNMTDYLNFTLEILGNTDMAQLEQWHREFMRDCIEPMMLPKALELIAKHREAGDKLVVITATNRFVTAPIVAQLGIDTLLATECEMADGRYTGRTTGVPCFREGKVTRLNQWLEDNAFSLEDSYFYSDSMNDLPLLEQVANPVAVDPDDKLRAEAERRGWPVITLRH